MLSKRFYDILVIVFVVLFLFGAFYSSHIVSKTFESAFSKNSSVESVTKVMTDLNNSFSYKFLSWSKWILGMAYWIFILILSIQFHKRNLISTTDVVVIAIFIPLAIVFYFLTLRKHFKEVLSEAIITQ